MQPLYFLPGMTEATIAPNKRFDRKALAARGLAETFSDVIGPDTDAYAGDVFGLGPGEKSGVVITYQTNTGAIPEPLGYVTDKQTWQQVNEGLWIGTTNDSPPRPEDMERKDRISGQWLELDAGHQWAIPVLRRPLTGTTELPRDMTFDAAGNVVEAVKARYSRIWEEAGETAIWFLPHLDEGGHQRDTFGGKTYTLTKALRRCVDVLGLNYRYSAIEQNALRVIDSTTFMAVLAWSIDLPKVKDILEATSKKNCASQEEPQSITPGSLAS